MSGLFHYWGLEWILMQRSPILVCPQAEIRINWKDEEGNLDNGEEKKGIFRAVVLPYVKKWSKFTIIFVRPILKIREASSGGIDLIKSDWNLKRENWKISIYFVFSSSKGLWQAEYKIPILLGAALSYLTQRKTSFLVKRESATPSRKNCQNFSFIWTREKLHFTWKGRGRHHPGKIVKISHLSEPETNFISREKGERDTIQEKWSKFPSRPTICPNLSWGARTAREIVKEWGLGKRQRYRSEIP